MANIYESINNVMNAVGAVAKAATNPQQGYKYRGIDAVMNALHPAMSANKIFCSPEVLEETREERTTAKGGLLIYSILKVKYTFYAEDGSNVSAIVVGEGMDSGDKSSNKAMSAAFKYACFQVFCIPTEEMKDSEEDSPEPIGKDINNNPPANDAASDAQIKYIKTLCEKSGITYEKLLESNGLNINEPISKKQASGFIDGFNKKGVK